MSREVMQQALEALEAGWSVAYTGKDARQLGEVAIAALRAALDAPRPESDAQRYRKLVASGKFCASGSGAGWALVCGVGRADKAELDAAADALPSAPEAL